MAPDPRNKLPERKVPPATSRRGASLGDDDNEATMVDPALQRRNAAMARPEKAKAAVKAEELEFPIPAGWEDAISFEDFWARVHDLEKAQQAGGAALELALSAYDLQGVEHFAWLRQRFEARHAKDPAFKCAAARKK